MGVNMRFFLAVLSVLSWNNGALRAQETVDLEWQRDRKSVV